MPVVRLRNVLSDKERNKRRHGGGGGDLTDLRKTGVCVCRRWESSNDSFVPASLMPTERGKVVANITRGFIVIGVELRQLPRLPEYKENGGFLRKNHRLGGAAIAFYYPCTLFYFPFEGCGLH